jgi:hypothetical protein
MIYRAEADGWRLITQPAHAWLAGELCALWGNQHFDAPSPFEAIVLATRLHDIGWLSWDARPRLDENGRPVNFLNTNLSETIPIWRQAVQQLRLLDPYAALLVSKHATTIYTLRLERETDPPESLDDLRILLTEQEDFRQELIESLADHPVYGPEIDPERLHFAYRWLRVCDLLSLALCADMLPDSGEIKHVPGSKSSDFGVIHYQRPKPFKLILEPYPFSRSPLQLGIQTRFLEQAAYPDQDTFLLALEQTPWLPQKITISPS